MIPDLSKSAQLSRATSARRRYCDTTGEDRAECDCPSCRGSRNSRKGRKGQRQARRSLRLQPERYATKQGNEESWRSALRLEVKSGAQAQPVNTRYVNARQQSDAARPIGDTRPFAFIANPDGSTPLLVCRTDELREIVWALAVEWGWADPDPDQHLPSQP